MVGNKLVMMVIIDTKLTLERQGGTVSAPLSIFNLEALNGLISYVVYSLGYI